MDSHALLRPSASPNILSIPRLSPAVPLQPPNPPQKVWLVFTLSTTATPPFYPAYRLNGVFRSHLTLSERTSALSGKYTPITHATGDGHNLKISITEHSGTGWTVKKYGVAKDFPEAGELLQEALEEAVGHHVVHEFGDEFLEERGGEGEAFKYGWRLVFLDGRVLGADCLEVDVADGEWRIPMEVDEGGSMESGGRALEVIEEEQEEEDEIECGYGDVEESEGGQGVGTHSGTFTERLKRCLEE
ncbi:hypothetical protein P154DRAFT_532649 [Amniculicola lignicola CBS 123094]|uniref:Uncharacterized protein n=1 Tax=Amniculicola lignicola CBS 123094 TaxID=1392246 RepID=A0A6A5WMT6_9PLEO|nr:hypothetical protein P154DRAFT_532649 [Amniculicola lignicola CBS 123094]